MIPIDSSNHIPFLSPSNSEDIDALAQMKRGSFSYEKATCQLLLEKIERAPDL